VINRLTDLAQDTLRRMLSTGLGYRSAMINTVWEAYIYASA